MQTMIAGIKKKLKVPGGCDTPDLTRLDKLLRKAADDPIKENNPAKAHKRKKKRSERDFAP
jgi:hypothetical protein